MSSTDIRPREDPIRLRDAALHRISVTRRWMIVAAAGLTAGFAALVSALLPGKSLGAKSTVAATPAARSVPSATTVTPPLPAPASAAQLGVGASGQSQQSIAPPAAAPQPAPSQSAPAQPTPAAAPAPAVSGGS